MLHNYLIFLFIRPTLPHEVNLNPPTIPEERSDEEDDHVRPSPGLPRPTFSFSLLSFNSHLSIATCFNRKQNFQTLKHGYFLEFSGQVLF